MSYEFVTLLAHCQIEINLDFVFNKKDILENKVQHCLTKFWDCLHFQLAKHAVFDEESDVQVKNKQFRSPGAKNEEKLPQKNYVLIRCVLLFIP